MKAEKSAILLYYSFIKSLSSIANKVAVLQLSGRLESFLVSEFISHISKASHGQRLALSNVGARGQQIIDVAILKGELPESAEVVALLEVKYLRNRHRFHEWSAEDEILTELKSLRSQLGAYDQDRLGLF